MQGSVRIEANGRAVEAGSVSSGTGGGDLAVAPAAAEAVALQPLQPLRLHPVRRTMGTIEEGEAEAAGVAGQQLLTGAGSGALGQEQHPPAADQQQQQQRRYVQYAAGLTDSDDEELGGMGSGSAKAAAAAAVAAGGGISSAMRRPGTPQTPSSLRRNSKIALLSMLLLVFQGTALSIMLRYSRARAGQAYLASVSGESPNPGCAGCCTVALCSIAESLCRDGEGGGGGAGGTPGGHTAWGRCPLHGNPFAGCWLLCRAIHNPQPPFSIPPALPPFLPLLALLFPCSNFH